jgi:hypothetical protein
MIVNREGDREGDLNLLARFELLGALMAMTKFELEQKLGSCPRSSAGIHGAEQPILNNPVPTETSMSEEDALFWSPLEPPSHTQW